MKTNPLPILLALTALAVSLPSSSQTKASTGAAAAAPAATPAKPATAAGPATLKPGVWEVVTAIETAGSNVRRSIAARSCLSADDVTDVRRVVPPQREFGLKCETTDARQKGAETTWRVSCTGKDGTLAGGGKMTLATDSFGGSAELERKSPGAKPVKVVQKITGKWIEACK